MYSRGQTVIVNIAELMGVEPPTTDIEGDPAPMVAFIDEEMCIGCTKCIQACPVDAIIGTNKAMHTIIPDFVRAVNFVCHLVQQIVFP